MAALGFLILFSGVFSGYVAAAQPGAVLDPRPRAHGAGRRRRDPRTARRLGDRRGAGDGGVAADLVAPAAERGPPPRRRRGAGAGRGWSSTPAGPRPRRSAADAGERVARRPPRLPRARPAPDRDRRPHRRPRPPDRGPRAGSTAMRSARPTPDATASPPSGRRSPPALPPSCATRRRACRARPRPRRRRGAGGARPRPRRARPRLARPPARPDRARDPAPRRRRPRELDESSACGCSASTRSRPPPPPAKRSASGSARRLGGAGPGRPRRRRPAPPAPASRRPPPRPRPRQHALGLAAQQPPRRRSAWRSRSSIAQLADVQHGFWVVLGTMSVLRSSALATGTGSAGRCSARWPGSSPAASSPRRRRQPDAALGACSRSPSLLAGYTPRAVSFAAGQAGFSLLVLILFNLIDRPAGRSGWCGSRTRDRRRRQPAGRPAALAARRRTAVLRDALADAYASAAELLEATSPHCCAASRRRRPLARAAFDAGQVLDATLRDYVADRGAGASIQDLSLLLLGARRLRQVSPPARPRRRPRPAGAAAAVAPAGRGRPPPARGRGGGGDAAGTRRWADRWPPSSRRRAPPTRRPGRGRAEPAAAGGRGLEMARPGRRRPAAGRRDRLGRAATWRCWKRSRPGSPARRRRSARPARRPAEARRRRAPQLRPGPPRRGEQEALAQRHPQRPQPRQLGAELDALGDEEAADLGGVAAERADQGGAVVVGVDAADQRAVELHVVGGEPVTWRSPE